VSKEEQRKLRDAVRKLEQTGKMGKVSIEEHWALISDGCTNACQVSCTAHQCELRVTSG